MKKNWKKFWYKPNPEGVRGIDVLQVFVFGISLVLILGYITTFIK